MKHLPKSKIEFEISVAWPEWGKHIEQAVADASQEIKISGFRPGKAPRNLVEQKVGKGKILSGAAHKAIEKSYVEFVTREKLEIIGHPNIEITQIEEEKDLKYKVTVAVLPTLKIKDQYKKDVSKVNQNFAKKDKSIKDSEIDLELEKLANGRAKLVTVRREAQKNDSVEIDFSVLMGRVPIENGTSKNHPLVLGKGVFIPGFEENIIGMKEGEEKTFELPFPESYHKKDLAGKPANFKVKVNLVQERQIPEINDEFAASLGKFSSLEDIKKNIREGLEHEKEHKDQEGRRTEIIEAIVNNSEVDLPDILVEKEIEKMLEEFEYQTQSMGMGLDGYLAKIGKNKDDLKKDWREQAVRRVISALAISQIAEAEDIKAESAEIEAEMNKTLQYYKKVKDAQKNIGMERLYNYSKGVLENEKVFDFLEKL